MSRLLQARTETEILIALVAAVRGAPGGGGSDVGDAASLVAECASRGTRRIPRTALQHAAS